MCKKAQDYDLSLTKKAEIILNPLGWEQRKPEQEPHRLGIKGCRFFRPSPFFFFLYRKKATEPATTIVLSSDVFHDDVLPSVLRDRSAQESNSSIGSSFP